MGSDGRITETHAHGFHVVNAFGVIGSLSCARPLLNTAATDHGLASDPPLFVGSRVESKCLAQPTLGMGIS